MKTALDIIAEIQMILAERRLSKGAASDREYLDRIAELLDTPEVVGVALDLVPPPRDGSSGESSPQG